MTDNSFAYTVLSLVRNLRKVILLLWESHRALFVIVVALSLLLGLLPLFTVVLSSLLITALANGTETSQIFPLILYISLVAFFGQIIRHISQVVSDLFQLKVTENIQLKLAEKSASLDYSMFEDVNTQNQLQVANQESSYRPILVLQQLVQSVTILSTLVSTGAIIASWQIWFIPLCLIGAIVTLAVASFIEKRHVKVVLSRAEKERQALYLSFTLSDERTSKEVRLFGLKFLFLERLSAIYSSIYSQEKTVAQQKVLFSGLTEGLFVLLIPLAIGLAAMQTISGVISIGEFSLYSQTIVLLQANSQQLVQMLAELYKNNLFINTLFSVLSLPSEVPLKQTPTNAMTSENRDIAKLPVPLITFENVSFIYPRTEHTVLENVSFTINPGEVVALVGENGSGKTTLVKILTGLYKPSSGRVLFDGVDIQTLDPHELRQYISVTLQDFVIYHLSLLDNISIGDVNSKSNTKAVERAATLSGAHDIAMQLPHGYNTVLSRFFDQGHELSGGQQQVVAVTRALFREAPVCILDEPAAHLDIHAEQKLFQSLLNNRAARTQSVIFISHRFATIRHADRILVLDRGKLIEQGSHNELLLLQGRYAQMFQAQLEQYGFSSE